MLAFISNHMWDLVPRTPNANIVSCIYKFDNHGNLWTFHRLIGRSRLSQKNLELIFGDTFSPVAKPTTIYIVLSIVCVLYMSYAHKFANIFTKGLPKQIFLDFQNSLGIREPPHLSGRVKILLLKYCCINLQTLTDFPHIKEEWNLPSLHNHFSLVISILSFSISSFFIQETIILTRENNPLHACLWRIFYCYLLTLTNVLISHNLYI